MSEKTFEFEGKIFRYLSESEEKDVIRMLAKEAVRRGRERSIDAFKTFLKNIGEENFQSFRKYNDYGMNAILEENNLWDETHPKSSPQSHEIIKEEGSEEKMANMKKVIEKAEALLEQENGIDIIKGNLQETKTTEPAAKETEKEEKEAIEALSTDFHEASQQIERILKGEPEPRLFTKGDEELEPSDKPRKENYIFNEDYIKALEEWKKASH